MSHIFSRGKRDTAQPRVDSYARVAGCLGPSASVPMADAMGYRMTPALRATL